MNSIARTTIDDPWEGLCKVKSGQKTLNPYAERTKCTAGLEQSRAGCGRRPGRPTPGSVPLSSHLFMEKERQAQATWRAAGGLDSTLYLLEREKGE